MLDYGKCSESVHFQFVNSVGSSNGAARFSRGIGWNCRDIVCIQNTRFTIVSFMAKRRKRQANPGAELRAIRQQLGWSLREVHAASVALARKHRQPAFVIAPSVLHRIETRNSTPSIHRLYALALIYGRTFKEILSLYGIHCDGRFVRFSEQA